MNIIERVKEQYPSRFDPYDFQREIILKAGRLQSSLLKMGRKNYLWLAAVLILTLPGCCNTAGFKDSMLCYMLRGELENYPVTGSRSETIRIYDGVTGEYLREYRIDRR